MSGRGTAIREFLEAIGRAFRGPAPAPLPAPAPPRPAPSPTQPRPDPTPPRDPQPTPPWRPIPPPRQGETETDPWPETQTEPETTPDRQTETEGATDLEDDPSCRNCPEYAARDMGAAADRPAPQTPPTSKRGYDYQHFVCPWYWYTPATARIEEGNFSGVYFDGLHPADCHLYEAKHGYDGFWKQETGPPRGGPELRPWAVKARIQENVFDRMVEQAGRQHSVVLPHFGEVQLSWVFIHIDTRLYVGRLVLDEVDGWYHEMEVRPWTSG